MVGEKILIVEDEPITAEAISIMLKELHYNPVNTASTGEEAIDSAQKYQPDVILMDIMLDGEMTGIQAAELIHSKRDTPIIYLTAYGDIETLTQAKKTDPLGYIVKPITDSSNLRANIELAIYNSKVKKILEQDAQKYNQVKDFVLHDLGLEKSTRNDTDGGKVSRRDTMEIDPDDAKNKLIIYLDAVSNQERFSIFDQLRTQSLRIFEIQELINKTQSTASHHMKILETAGLVSGWKKERLTQFSLNKKCCEEFIELLKWWITGFPFGISAQSESITITDSDKTYLSVCFEALGSEDRFEIMERFKQKAQSVSVLEQSLNKPQSTIYHHIKQLEQAGLITSVISGKFTEYMPIDVNIIRFVDLAKRWIQEITNWFGFRS